MGRTRWSPPDRAGRNDLLQLHYGGSAAETQVGAVLIVGAGPPLPLEALRRAIGGRLRAVPRLRQRLTATPPGSGPPVWVDDPVFDIARQVHEIGCPPPGDERALLDLAVALVTTPLPADRPRWSATLVRDLSGGRTGLVLAFHHVLADGVGGLAVLARLVDPGPPPAPDPFPRPVPPRWWLAADAARARLRALRRVPSGLLRLGAALGQSRGGLTTRAPRISLNRPTGPRRRLAVARADLGAIRAAAHAGGGTVNDAFLAAVTGALRSFLWTRGERHDGFVVGVLASGHTAGDDNPVRNQIGVVPLLLPAAGDPLDRLREIARRTRRLRGGRGARGATAVLIEPVFAALARLRVVRWYVSHQRRVNVFATNLRGPAEPMTLLGAPVTDLVPVNTAAGNIAVAFGALSYAGTLTITVVADPEVCPEVERLAAGVRHQLDAFASMAV